MKKSIHEVMMQQGGKFDIVTTGDLIIILGFYKLINDVREDREHIRASYQLLEYSNNVNIDNLIKNPDYNELESQLKEVLEHFPSFEIILKHLKKLNEDEFKIFLSSIIPLLKSELNFGEELVRGKYDSICEKFKLMIKTIDFTTFVTPTSVIEIFNEILKVSPEETFMDPCFGMGNLALALGKNSKKVIGYDINKRILDFGKMLFEIADKTAELQVKNSLEGEMNSADIVATKIPFSVRGEGSEIDYKNRNYLKWGTPSRTNENFSFISLVVAKMKKRGAVLVPEGSLFRSGAEGNIREKLIKDGLIAGVISLPAGLLAPHIAIATSIIFFDKENRNENIFIMDGKEYFKKLSRTLSITEENLNKLVQDYKERKEISGTSRVVSAEELEKNGYVLNSNRYIEIKKNERKLEDIEKAFKESFEKSLESRKICDEILKRL